MALLKWEPWADMLSAQRDMQSLLSRFFGDPRAASGGLWGQQGAFLPAVEVLTRDSDLLVRAELPGVDPERDVDISLTDNVLTIRGERRRHEESNGDRYYRSETTYGSF